MPLSQVIANDRAYKLKQDSQREEQRDVSDFVAFLLPFGTRRQNKELSSSNSSLSSTSETPNESTSPNTPEPAPRARRRVSRPITMWYMSVRLEGLAGAGKNPVVSGLCDISPVMFEWWFFFFLGGTGLVNTRKLYLGWKCSFSDACEERSYGQCKCVTDHKVGERLFRSLSVHSFIYLLLSRSSRINKFHLSSI